MYFPQVKYIHVQILPCFEKAAIFKFLFMLNCYLVYQKYLENLAINTSLNFLQKEEYRKLFSFYIFIQHASLGYC